MQDPLKIENEVINYGMIRSLHTQISANELAAKGIQLSLRNALIGFIKKMDHEGNQTKESAELLGMLERNNNNEDNNVDNNNQEQMANTNNIVSDDQIMSDKPLIQSLSL